ncbi:hypothetical protein PR202_gb11674 [Eleusine coracana subsp. coracana]|uniref:AAA+ ATPase domain-containing protein n=1 Tax=Eleusine coracana subsp. coracana TaxID=191504 RepID=A0AAV5EMB3_ELECO|nr:hypothetical protein PR202_gb11674 [Eleusine coracana subsp. coracana]
MPPKGKKKRSAASPQVSPRTPSSRSLDSEGGCSLDLASVAAAAAAQFPTLVPRGGAGCFAGTVTDVGPRSGSRGRLWLSEPAMVGAGMRPGCLVSVSVISSSCHRLDGFPLDDLFEECSKSFDLDADSDLLCSEAGRSFVVATVFPSQEVQKIGIKLSWDLACTLGYPSAGQSLFINPLHTSQAPKETKDADIFPVIKCKEVFLALVPPNIGASSGTEPVSDCDSARKGVITESPKKTPSTPVRRNESHDFASKNGSSLCLDPTTACSALADEKINALLQTSALRWLCGRHLLKGNYVPLSMCGKLSLFLVIGAEPDSSGMEVLYDKGNPLNNVETSSKMGEAPVSFLVDRTTKVHLSASVSSEKLGSDKPDLPLESSMVYGKRNEDSSDAPMLGGLSKESGTIKEIISFSLADHIDVPRYKGVLLYGPPGTGKTSLAALCAHDAGANLFTINGPEIISQYFGESEQMLFDVFSSAKQAAPAVEQLSRICPLAELVQPKVLPTPAYRPPLRGGDHDKFLEDINLTPPNFAPPEDQIVKGSSPNRQPVKDRFGAPSSSNHLGSLLHLRQTGSLDDYITGFLEHLMQLEFLRPVHQTMLFTAGLTDLLKIELELRQPPCLNSAIALAKDFARALPAPPLPEELGDASTQPVSPIQISLHAVTGFNSHRTMQMDARVNNCTIFIDELDAIAPARKDGGEELSLRMWISIVVLNWHAGVPSPGQRLDILHHLLIGVHHSLTGVELESLAQTTHGFVGADLAALCNEAALSALRRYINLKENSTQWLNNHDTSMDKGNNQESLGHLGDQISLLSSSLSELSMSSADFPCTKGSITESSESNDGKVLLVTAEDFEKAKVKVRPSAMREVMLELPKVRWQDVGGQARVKKQLIEAIQWPQKCPEAFERIGIRPPRGLLMIGPPGCSKTLMARAVASEAKLNFLAVKGPELFSKWVGDSEKAVRSLFAKARANAPAILFFDEIDGLAVTRGHENDGTSVADRVLSQLLVEMDGLDQRIGVTVIAATNRPDKIDHALLRPGRFDRLLDVQPPDEGDREDIFRIHTRSMPCSPDVNLNELARLTEGYTGADIKLVCREAAVAALDENFEISDVAIRHFKSAINRIKPSDVKFYQELAAQFRRFVDDASRRNQ